MDQKGATFNGKLIVCPDLSSEYLSIREFDRIEMMQTAASFVIVSYGYRNLRFILYLPEAELPTLKVCLDITGSFALWRAG